MTKEDGRSKLDISSGTVQAKRKANMEKNRETDPQLGFMEKFEDLFYPECWEGNFCPWVPM